MRQVKILFEPEGAWEEWIAEVPDDADEDWVNSNLDEVAANLVGLNDAGNTTLGMPVNVEFFDE